MLHCVFTRDFALLAIKSKHELKEVIYDSLDFFALKGYLAFTGWSVFRFFLWFRVCLVDCSSYDQYQSLDIILGQLHCDLLDNFSDLNQLVFFWVFRWLHSLSADLLNIGKSLLNSLIWCVFELALL